MLSPVIADWSFLQTELDQRRHHGDADRCWGAPL